MEAEAFEGRAAIVTRSRAKRQHGGNKTSGEIKEEKEKIADSVVPTEVPSIVELKKALPSHCFQSSLLTSYYYVVKDLAIICALYAAYLFVERHSPSPVLVWIAAAPVYAYLQGTMMWALFVLGHDCGHGSFSKYPLLNDLTGTLLHAIILVPYYPWKVSHQQHHKNTGNIDKDEIFYPVRQRDICRRRKFIPLFGFGISWFLYLVRGYAPRPASHVNPFHPLFARHLVACLASLAMVVAWVVLALAPYAAHVGTARFAAHYLMPIFNFASWLVVTTFLHHQVAPCLLSTIFPPPFSLPRSSDCRPPSCSFCPG